jgi:hypothetical protein
MWKTAAGFMSLVLVAGCTTTSQDSATTGTTEADTNTVAAIKAPAAPSAAKPTTPAAKSAAKPATPPSSSPAAQPPANKPLPPKEAKIQNAAMGSVVTATSTNKKFPAELPPSALVDGDLTTRWSSEYADPQAIEVKLAKPLKIAKIRLHWENAVATKYSLSVSSDGKDWKGMHVFMKTDAKPETRVDEINLNGVSAAFIKLDLISRVNPDWGFSLYEIEVVPAE